MKHNYPDIGLGMICGLFGKTRQAWYAHGWEADQRGLEHSVVLELVRELRRELPRTGTPKLHKMLSESLDKHQIKMGRAALNDLLSEHNMLIRTKRRKPRTTNSAHWYRRYDNLIKELEISRPSQVWVSDITYISVGDHFGYLSLITDAYSRKIVGYALHDTLESTGPLAALSMALEITDQSAGPLIHHSDRGVQYCCNEYTGQLNEERISISMTQKGDPYENAIAERVNGILKAELGLNETFSTIEQARGVVDRAVINYNQLRPHASCNYLTPEQAHQQSGPLLKRWKNYRRATAKGPEDERFSLGMG